MATAFKKMAPQEWFALFARSARGLAFGLHETDFGDIQTYIALKRKETGRHARALLTEMLHQKGEASMETSSTLAEEEPHPALHAYRLAYLPSEAQSMSEVEADDVSELPTRIMTSIPIRLQASSLPSETKGDYKAETELLIESAIIKYVSHYGSDPELAWPAKIYLNPWRRLFGLEPWLRYWWLLDRRQGIYAEVFSEQGLPEDVVECIPPSQSRVEVTQEEPLEEDESLEQEEQSDVVSQQDFAAEWLYADNFTVLEIPPKEVPQEVTITEDQDRTEEEEADVRTETKAEEAEVLPEPEGALGAHLLDNDAVGA